MCVCVLPLSQLHYKLGRVDKERMNIEWTNSYIYYDKGNSASVTLLQTDGRVFVVEVHSSVIWTSCYCCVGEVNTKDMTITWGKSTKVGPGMRAKVSVKDDGTVIVFVEKMVGHTQYFIGKVQTTGDLCVEWKGDGTTLHEIPGSQIDIALSEENVVVMVYRHKGNLASVVGILTDNGEINWGLPSSFGEGLYPSVSIDSHGNVVECHHSTMLTRLSNRTGKVDIHKRSVIWNASVRYGTGVFPSTSLSDDGYVLEIHAKSSGFHSELCDSQGWLKGGQSGKNQQKKKCADLPEPEGLPDESDAFSHTIISSAGADDDTNSVGEQCTKTTYTDSLTDKMTKKLDFGDEHMQDSTTHQGDCCARDLSMGISEEELQTNCGGEEHKIKEDFEPKHQNEDEYEVVDEDGVVHNTYLDK